MKVQQNLNWSTETFQIINTKHQKKKKTFYPRRNQWKKSFIWEKFYCSQKHEKYQNKVFW